MHYFQINSKNSKPIVCIKQSTYMWYISWLSALSACYIYYRNYNLYALLPAAIFLTSINYWKHPTYGFRRNLDISCSFSVISLLYILAFNGSERIRFYILMTLAVSCYPVSIYIYNNNMHYVSTLVHSYIHIFGNMATFVLFSGYMPSIL